MTEINIIKTFLNLIRNVVPHGSEEKLVVPYLKGSLNNPEILEKDGFGNYFVKIGETETMFTSHLDTVGDMECDITPVFKDGYIGTDGTTILGGDNKAGVTIMIHMINNNIPGLYYFFLGEERGCHGSKWLLMHNKPLLRQYKRAIAFDRREKGSIITFQKSKRCASDAFGNALAEEFKKVEMDYRIDPNGYSTDTAVFVDIIPECTNLSAGVYGEHTMQERLNVEYFLKVCNAVLYIDWENLPSVRDVNKTEYERGINNYASGNMNPNFNNFFDGENFEDYEFMEPGIFPTEKEILKGVDVLLNKKLVSKIYVTDEEESTVLEEFEKINQDFIYTKELLNYHGYSTNENFRIGRDIEFKSYVFHDEFSFTLKIDWDRILMLNSDQPVEHMDIVNIVETSHKEFEKTNKDKKKENENSNYILKHDNTKNKKNKCDEYLVKKKYSKMVPPKSWEYRINLDGSISADGTVYLEKSDLTEIPFVFDKVNEMFNIFANKITSLIGSPVYVGKNFNCSNNLLTNLDFAPKHIQGNLICWGNKLEKGIRSYPPSIIEGSISADEVNNKLFLIINEIVKNNRVEFESIIFNPLLNDNEIGTEFRKLLLLKNPELNSEEFYTELENVE